jgi:hypothetical protein
MSIATTGSSSSRITQADGLALTYACAAGDAVGAGRRMAPTASRSFKRRRQGRP